MILGVSLKMYFSHSRTVEWMREIAAVVESGVGSNASEASIFVIPQYPSIPACLDIATPAGIAVGAQDVSTDDSGALTGEVSGAVLGEIGCRYVEIGHAERRRMFGDTDAIVARKVHASLRNGLVPILCVGEAEKMPPATAAAVCRAQIDSGLSEARVAGLTGAIVIAYEPLWAIGAAQPASPDFIGEVCGRLREHVRGSDTAVSVIYGGSAGPGLLPMIGSQADGLFLGRFAHDPKAFRVILEEAALLTV